MNTFLSILLIIVVFKLGQRAERKRIERQSYRL